MGESMKQLTPAEFPSLLREIPDAPKKLYVRGDLPEPDSKLLCVVGSRKYSTYGREVLEHLISGLRGYPISIVSGLALGIDALAHKAALDAGLYTLAVPGSGLDERVLYPRSNHLLARRILEAGGGWLSEFEPTHKAEPWDFPRRNRIMAGMSHATLVVEATLKSGTLITARLATDYNRDVLTVPGPVFSKNTEGPHMLLRLGATPVTRPEHILEALYIEPREGASAPSRADLSSAEQKILAVLSEPKSRDELIRELGLDSVTAAVLLSGLELKGIIVEHGGAIHTKI